ncbi:hypothetical protein SBRCBS47491_002994 [Sporothrix bragantina]|uniref:holo-[acyl-carrier-protein] synthase n=1 Tax=Sporothrix bragantina TaxID=671064 RepID=A0ABP0BBN9_9PEZI
MNRPSHSSAPARKLTPIHMRGKRKTNRSPVAGSSSSQSNNTDTETAAATSKLSLGSRSSSRNKRSREPSPASASAPGGSRSASRRMRAHRNTPVDHFPMEIIERIFFFSKNYNLPVASPRLGLMLSNRHTLRDVVMEAFAPYWNLSQIKDYREPNPKSKKGIAKRRAMKASLKNKILEQPWARMDLLVETLQIWLQKNKSRGKTYGHTICPYFRDPDMELAAKFVLDMKDLETLLESHPEGHIINIHDLDSNPGDYVYDSDSGDDDEEEEEEDSNDEEEEGEKEEEEEGESENENDDQEAGRPEKDNEGNPEEGNIEPRGGPHDVSAHVCFALDQYNALEPIYRNSPHDPKWDKEPHKLLEAYIAAPCRHDDSRNEDIYADEEPQPASGIQILMYRMSVSIYRRSASSQTVRIPEWLQLAGGPYPPNKSQTKEGRKALRDRLRDAFDMLTWLVLVGAQLQKKDSWETTWEGFQQLLKVDVRPHEWDAYEEGEAVVTMHHSYQHSAPDRPPRLQYGIDTLVAGMLAHFFALGVFYKQWPDDILKEAMQMATDFGKRENGAHIITQASRALAALLTDEERNGVLKYFHVRDAKMALASQLLKHLVVARCAGSDAPVPWRQTVLSRDKHGKPVYYRGEAGGSQPVVFNVSHQAGLVVLVAVYGGDIGDNSAYQVGIDIVSPSERRTRDHEMIADEARRSGTGPASGWPHFVDVHADVLAPGEVRYLKQLPFPDNDERLRSFYGLWCLREAYVKMTGEALLAEWLADLEFRAFHVPGMPSIAPSSTATNNNSLTQGEMVTQHDIRFRGALVGDSVNVCLRSVGVDFMVCTAVRAATEDEVKTPVIKATALSLPTTDAIEVLQMEDILDFVERSERL